MLGEKPVINCWGVIVKMWKTLNRVNPTGGWKKEGGEEKCKHGAYVHRNHKAY